LPDRLLASTLVHLSWLVAAPTENPPKRVAESGILERLASELGARFDVQTTDLGDGSYNLFARRGAPKVLWNFHLDTVPAAAGWDGSPFALQVRDDRAFGLGACDIKGAVAAMLSAVQATTADVALLFSTDEEAGKGRCIADFVSRDPAFDAVVVAEPTRAKAVLAHRGIGTASGRFLGRAGHASRADASSDSAIHEAVRWAARALDYVETFGAANPEGDLAGLRFNLGRIEGGEKPNVVAAEARLRFGVRPPPGRDPRATIEEVQALAPNPARVEWEPGFFGPPLPADAGDALATRGRDVAARLDLPVGPPVDFWTEAALFSARGYPAIVFGPGDIAQAHTKNEWVLLDELARVAHAYHRLLTPVWTPEAEAEEEA
jgi:acetylornithine deacetylase